MDTRKLYESKCVSAEKAVSAVQSGMRVGIPSGFPPELLIKALAKRRGDIAQKAVSAVQSGMRVGIPSGFPPELLIKALAKRRGEIADVEIFATSPRKQDWLQPGWEKDFNVVLNMGVGTAQDAVRERRVDYVPNLHSLHFRKRGLESSIRPIDIAFVTLSPPDENGNCSFGHWPANQKSYAEAARMVIAEVDERLVRTCGDNSIPVARVSQFVRRSDYSFAPSIYHQEERFGADKSSEVLKAIAANVASLIRDGDTIQVGPGTVVEPICEMGIFNGKHDLGCHSSVIPNSYLKAIRSSGAFTGKRKGVHTGKIVSSGVFVMNEAELAEVADNPLYELYPLEYVNAVPTLLRHNSIVPLNQALAVDFGGQIAVDGLGYQAYRGAAGQIEFSLGGVLTESGRTITIMPSTATTPKGMVSRIMPMMPLGTPITIPRYFADYIVTENGIAALFGKSLRQRADELIAIAHQDFRSDLKKEAQKLLWP